MLATSQANMEQLRNIISVKHRTN